LARVQNFIPGRARDARHRRLIGKQVAGGERVNHVHELPREYAYDAAAKGRSALRQWYDGLADAQRIVLRPIVAKLRSAANAADEEAEQQRQPKNELEGRAANGQRTQPSIRRARPEQKGFVDPFVYSNMARWPCQSARHATAP
jgi:hypothetical protein